MLTTDDLLFEIGTEELPPKSLYALALALLEEMKRLLIAAEFAFDDITVFATPRRLGFLVTKLTGEQRDRTVEKIGPSLALAYDQDGKPLPPGLGFAKSCQVTLDELTIKETPKGKCLCLIQQLKGESIQGLAPALIKKAIDALPISKPMRWGNVTEGFIRPVHWVVLMYGAAILPAHFFGHASGNKTYGHRFHHPGALVIPHPSDYASQLKTAGYVIPSYQERKEAIRSKVTLLGQSQGQVVIDDALLDEVTGLVEWPIPFLGNFDAQFLDIPQEALILAMKVHQKSFAVMTNTGLSPCFIGVSNIESRAPEVVIKGNERVMKARLTDAAFFYHTDLNQGMEHYAEQLKTVVFQHKLGTLHDKAVRISRLSGLIAAQTHGSIEDSERAGFLCKADLMTEMVGEFPELQGIMGGYYALKEGIPDAIARAIPAHYFPKFSGDLLPQTPIGNTVALADRLDTLVGIFGIHQVPTGEKDPFALRRAAVGVLRILIENKWPLDLRNLLSEAAHGYGALENLAVVDETLSFMMERLKSGYLDKGVGPDVFAAVIARYPTTPLDFDYRVKAVQAFQQLPESHALVAGNKRVSNLLKQVTPPSNVDINQGLLTLSPEKALANLVQKLSEQVELFCLNYQYTDALQCLVQLEAPINDFFDHVMVMVDDDALKYNRIILLASVHELFLKIADISLIHLINNP